MSNAITLTWTKRSNNAWHRLHELDYGAIDPYGIYVIWHGGFPSRVVRVGDGALREELRACCTDPKVIQYQDYGPLFVTWAVADPAAAASVRLHLADRLRPLIADSADPGVVAFAANSPF